jgi:hypothetical protein
MPNQKKHDSGASEGGRRPTEDAPESSANVGGAGGQPNARFRLSWNSCTVPTWRALPENIA